MFLFYGKYSTSFLLIGKSDTPRLGKIVAGSFPAGVAMFVQIVITKVICSHR